VQNFVQNRSKHRIYWISEDVQNLRFKTLSSGFWPTILQRCLRWFSAFIYPFLVFFYTYVLNKLNFFVFAILKKPDYFFSITILGDSNFVLYSEIRSGNSYFSESNFYSFLYLNYFQQIKL